MRRSRRGFSFAEVLFAVAVLGIGFIMVAAIFPVAIQQTQAALEETIGTSVARNGVGLVSASIRLRKDNPVGPVAYIEPTSNAPNAQGIYPGPRIFSFRDPRMTNAAGRAALWNSINSDLIYINDDRYAYIPMYSRENGVNYVRVMCVAVHCRNTSQYKKDIAAPNQGAGAVTPIELEPTPVAVTLEYHLPTSPNIITIDKLTPTDTNNVDLRNMSDSDAARVGAFVVISDDQLPDNPATAYRNENGSANGRVYRLGQNIGGNRWELSPDYDMASATEQLWPGSTSTKSIAFVVGAGHIAQGPPASGFGGGNCAVQVFDNLIALKD